MKGDGFMNYINLHRYKYGDKIASITIVTRVRTNFVQAKKFDCAYDII